MESSYHPRGRQPRYPLREQNHNPQSWRRARHNNFPVQGASSLQVSNHDYPFGNPLLTNKMHNPYHPAEGVPLTIPYQSPHKEEDCNSTRCQAKEVGHRRTHHYLKPKETPRAWMRKSCTRQKISNIELITQMWLGFPIHNAKATQQGLRIVKEKCTCEKILIMDTPPWCSILV